MYCVYYGGNLLGLWAHLVVDEDAWLGKQMNCQALRKINEAAVGAN